MAINIFEGSRRILLLLQVSWAMGAIAVNWRSHTIYTYYQTISPTSPFVKSGSPCSSDDRTEYSYSHSSVYGIDVSVDLCFKAREFEKGEKLVPYKVQDGNVWGNWKYSTDVDNYVRQRTRSFLIPLEDEKSLEEQAKENLAEGIKDGLQFALGGWFALWLAGTAIGWIVRGFMGIPGKMDTKP